MSVEKRHRITISSEIDFNLSHRQLIFNGVPRVKGCATVGIRVLVHFETITKLITHHVTPLNLSGLGEDFEENLAKCIGLDIGCDDVSVID